MIYPPISELMKKVDSRYTLCTLVAKRARKILDGAHPVSDCDSKKPVSIAAMEVYEGKLTYVRTKSSLK